MSFRSLFCSGAFAVVAASLGPKPVLADGVPVPGGTLGGQLYNDADTQFFMMHLGSQAQYRNSLYFWLAIGASPLSNSSLFSNRNPTGHTVEWAIGPGIEMLFSACVNVPVGLLDASACTRTNAFAMGPGERNSDGLPHAMTWTREQYIAGCGIVPSSCDPTGLALLVADPSYGFVVGFEDSVGYGIDHDFNDLVFALRGVTTVPEPFTISLVAAGLAGIGAASR